MASRRARLARGLVVEVLEPAPATSAARATVVSMVTSERDYLACARQCLLELEQDKVLFCSAQVATELRQAPRRAAFGVAIVVVADCIELSRLAFDFRSREQVVRWLDQAPGFPLETSQRATYMAKSYAVSSTVAFARSAFRCQVHVWVRAARVRSQLIDRLTLATGASKGAPRIARSTIWSLSCTPWLSTTSRMCARICSWCSNPDRKASRPLRSGAARPAVS